MIGTGVPSNRRGRATISAFVLLLGISLFVVPIGTIAAQAIPPPPPPPHTITLNSGGVSTDWEIIDAATSPDLTSRIGESGTTIEPDVGVSPCDQYGSITDASWVTVSDGTIGSTGCDTNDGDPSSSAVDYTVTTAYTATFTLPAGYTHPSISGSFLADNIGSVLLNGDTLASQSGADDCAALACPTDNYQTATSFSATDPSHFVTGSNTLEFDVVDYGGVTGVDYTATVNYGPSDPTDLAQFDSSNAAISVGGLTHDNTINFTGTVSDPDGEQAQLEVQAEIVNDAFSGTSPDAVSALVDSGTTATSQLTGLADGEYHWRARAVDANGLTSGWVSFGDNSDSPLPAATDFRINDPGTPTLHQYKPNGTEISVGGNTDGEGGNDRQTVVLGANVTETDPNSDVDLEVQVEQVGTDFNGDVPSTPDLYSGSVTGSGDITATFSGLTADANYHWRARAVDDRGFASDWVSFGGNSESATDFRVPEADLSLTKTESAVAAAQCPNPVQIYLCVMAGRNLTYTLSATNAGPDDASHVKVTDTLPSDTTYVSASGTGWTCGHVGQVVTCTRPTLSTTTAPDISIVATANGTLRHGPLSITNDASVTSDVFDPDEATGGNDASVDTEVHTVAEPPSKYDLQPGNTDAVASWSAPVANGGAANGGEPVDFYRIVVTANSGSATGTGTFDVYNPATPGPAGTFVWTSCTGRLGGTFCYRLTGLKNDDHVPPSLFYTFTIQAHNAVGLSDADTATATPSTNNRAVIVAAATTSSISTCTTATKTNPICIQFQVPSGGGGVFSLQDTIQGYSTFDFSTFCGGPCTAGKGLGSFEGHPPAGYNDPRNPMVIIATWDQSAWDGVTSTQNQVWYQADSLHGGVPFLLAKCTNPNVDTAFPDPCLKKTNILGRMVPGCSTNAACFGDLQAQILLTSAADGGFSKH
jgi:uncharacterized repeat protein (TIGR01451 family)